MRSEFNNVYEHIIESYDDARDSTPFQKKTYIETKKGISVTVHGLVNHYRKSGYEVRPDAVHFLIINLHQLVALPLALESQVDKKIMQKLHIDTKSILNEAIKISEEKNQLRKIPNTNDFSRPGNKLTLTGGDVIKAVGRMYDKLNLSQIQLWGG
ncbi:hypothetical protein R7F07_24080 [Vibrio sp. YT-16]|uniref:hypothetical protein n=1 Tax=Vibrio TaxID=662 RepID=UPI00148CE24E|nr:MULTISPECIES: hypothetical protein [Vibrio]MDW1465577.1 hypothetical protein [Vibrio sp. YT-16]NOH90869.1 hypothetical protein [Vibrio alginolyticus]